MGSNIVLLSTKSILLLLHSLNYHLYPSLLLYLSFQKIFYLYEGGDGKTGENYNSSSENTLESYNWVLAKIKPKDDSDNLTENKDKQKRILPRRCCCDFIDNYFCGGICCCLERQKLIYNCKGIVLNYFSVENIIYSQIMLENLLKDYKWNNKSLNDIQNNKMIIKLKNY